MATIGAGRIRPRVVEAIIAYLIGTREARDRIAVLTDLLAYLRLRRTRSGTSPEGVEVLEALARRLEMELAAGDDAPAQASRRS